MRKIILAFSFMVLSLFLTASELFAKEASSEIQIGQWKGGSYYLKNGEFTHCFIAADYETGIRILFTLTSTYNFSMAFINPGWNLTIGDKYPVKYWVDKYKARNGTAIAKSTSFTTMALENTNELFEEMLKYSANFCL